MDLHKVANTPGFGSGQRARDRLAFQKRIEELLPDPAWMQELVVRIGGDLDSNHIRMAHFGCSTERGKDVQIEVQPFDLETWVFGQDAATDAEVVAAIVNAYAMGMLVRAAS